MQTRDNLNWFSTYSNGQAQLGLTLVSNSMLFLAPTLLVGLCIQLIPIIQRKN